MQCPRCHNDSDKVLESRHNRTGTSIRRRRQCLACGYRFTSYERIEDKPLLVVKRDGRREPFDIDKIERGLRRSLEKRSVSNSVIEEILRDIEDQAYMRSKSSHEIDSDVLGEMLLKQLYEIDRVAYVRFASVYRHFDNVNEFIEVISDLGGEHEQG